MESPYFFEAVFLEGFEGNVNLGAAINPI